MQPHTPCNHPHTGTALSPQPTPTRIFTGRLFYLSFSHLFWVNLALAGKEKTTECRHEISEPLPIFFAFNGHLPAHCTPTHPSSLINKFL